MGFQLTSVGSYTKGDLVFRTRDSTNDVATTERMRIDASGIVGIGTTPSGFLTSGYVLRLNGGTQTYLAFNNNTHTTQATGGFVIGNDASAAYITQREDQPIVFATSDTERLRIDQYGGITGTMFNANNGEYDGDLDSLKKTGFYRSKNTNNGNPSVAFYSVVVYGNQGNVTAQIATLLAGPATYVRSFNVSWTSWVRIDD